MHVHTPTLAHVHSPMHVHTPVHVHTPTHIHTHAAASPLALPAPLEAYRAFEYLHGHEREHEHEHEHEQGRGASPGVMEKAFDAAAAACALYAGSGGAHWGSDGSGGELFPSQGFIGSPSPSLSPMHMHALGCWGEQVQVQTGASPFPALAGPHL